MACPDLVTGTLFSHPPQADQTTLAQCDGQMPCRRCRSRGEECAYEDKKWRTKDHLRSEIERLRAEQRQGHALIRALTRNDPQQWEAVLSRMRSNEPPEAIAEWIHASRAPPAPPRHPSHGLAGTGQFGDPSSSSVSHPHYRSASIPDIPPSERLRAASFSGLSSNSFGPSAPSFQGDPPSPFSAHFSPACRFPFGSSDCPTFTPQRPPPLFTSPFDPGASPSAARCPLTTPVTGITDRPILRTWTNVTSDSLLVQRLLAKFFSTSLLSFSLVPKPQFIKGFRDGDPRFCSEALVNAILGWACKAFDTTSTLISRVTYGDAFLGEAKRLLTSDQHHANLPSIQALGVLALAEISQGHDQDAWDLGWESVRASIHLNLQTQHTNLDADFKAVRAVTYCAGFSLIRYAWILDCIVCITADLVVRMLRLLTGRLETGSGPLFMKLRHESEDLGSDAPQARVERGWSGPHARLTVNLVANLLCRHRAADAVLCRAPGLFPTCQIYL